MFRRSRPPLLMCCIGLLLQGINLSFSQQPRFQHFSSEQGLSENVIYSILQDKKGFLWIGTWDGLNRYDGYGFKKFYHKSADTNSVSGNTIHSLYEDERGLIWIGTNGGLCSYDPGTEKFSKAFRSQDSTIRNVMRVTELSKTELLLQTLNAIFSFNTLTKELKTVFFEINGKPVLLPNLGTVFKDENGELYICDSKPFVLSIYRYSLEQKIFQPYNSHFLKVPATFRLLGTRHFVRDAKKQIWIATSMGRIMVFDSEGNFLPLNHHSLLQMNHSVQCMYNDAAGNLWMGTENGLLHYDAAADQLYQYGSATENALNSPIINCIYKDRSGVLWLGTLNGLSKLMPQQKKFRHLTASLSGSNGLYNDFILGLQLEGNDQLRIHYNYGVLYFSRLDLKTNTTQHYAKQHYDRNKFIKELVIENADRLDAEALDFFKDLLYNSSEWSYLLSPLMIADTGNKVWYASLNSFGCYVPGEKKRFEKKIIGQFNGEVYDMQLFNNSLWFATATDGLVCYNIGAGTLKKYMAHAQDPGSISSNEVLCFMPVPGGNIWVGTKGGGLNYLDLSSGKFIHYTVEQGLCNNTIYCMVKDDEGNLWLGTSNGLSKFDPVKKHFRNYSRSDGLINSEFNRYSAVKSADGHLWFGGINGVDHFHPAEIIDDEKASEMGITGIKIFDRDISPASTSLSLSHRDNYITFEFAVMDFRNPAGNKFAYKLAGIDKDWVNVENRNFVSYPTLRPGRYRFLLKGANSEGVWVKEPIELAFTIHPPWWGTWWFYTLCAATLAGLLYALYDFRIRQLKKMMMLRTKISQDLHDEVGSTLSGIALYSSLAKKQLLSSNGEKTEKSLSVIEQSAADMVDKLNDIVWAVNPKNDSLSILLKRLEDYTYEMATAKNIEVISHVDEQTEKISLPMELRKNIYLVCKESINNAVKYAQCSTLYFNTELTDHQLKIEIADNGKGFDPDLVKMGNGLNNMRARAQEIHAQLEIDSKNGTGTAVRLVCKIPR